MNMPAPPFQKILVANRGEIAIRIFRAATELGIRTVAVHSWEDRQSLHRYKADEAYMVGKRGDPIGAYLAIDEIIEIARRKGVQAIHPGYGFLSENAAFAAACADANIVFVGPPAPVVAMMGDKTVARELAEREGVPTVPGMKDATLDLEPVRAFAERVGYPVMVKAAHGGGGRGMRVVRSAGELDEAFRRAASEARAAFGRGEVFAEKYVERPRHIEVQILADRHGRIVHLHERDCSIQRRHQKLVELAPAPNLPASIRQRVLDYSLRLGRASGFVNAGTVEFLVSGEDVYFLEVNPRIQVEHTVTEMITGIDLVQSQIQVAAGRRLEDPEIGIADQDEVECHGAAIQCRITTEDPSKGFAPDTGTIRVYRSAAGFGIRLDASVGGAGTEVSPHYDSLIVKVTASASSLVKAASKLRRSLLEFRIRGVATNIPFLMNVVTHPKFLAGRTDTTFVDETPELFRMPRRRDRASRTLRALADILVNGPPGMKEKPHPPRHFIEPELPKVPVDAPPLGDPRRFLLEQGATALSRWILEQERLLVTDTTFRDAHQSLLATRVRTADLIAVAPATAHLAPGLFSHEMWGGATFDVCMRFLKEDPWERLLELRKRIPNVLFQMLLRGANAVGYSNYPDDVVKAFIREAAAGGIDVFRIFDGLNNLSNMELSIAEVLRTGKVAEAAICYTADCLTSRKYDLTYYVRLATELEKRGAHVLAIKDMAGLLKPWSARALVHELKSRLSIPVHLHTHDTSGNGIATYLMAADAGVDVVDCALSSMSGLTSQPSLNALVAALNGHPRDTGLAPEGLLTLANYWERVRELYHPFESGLKAGTAEVYVHEIPGGQYSNLRPQAHELGLGGKWDLMKRRYHEVDQAFGGLIKVTPISKVVGDLALFLVQNDLTLEDLIEKGTTLDFPQSVVQFANGDLGEPYGGFPEALRRVLLKGKPPTPRPQPAAVPLDPAAFGPEVAEALDRPPTMREAVSAALYPQVFKEYIQARAEMGNISRLPTKFFLYGLDPREEALIDIDEGKTLVVHLLAVGDAQPDGKRPVYFELNGQWRAVAVVDRALTSSVRTRPKADPGNPGHVGAPMRGKVVSVAVKAGARVAAGDRLLATEAMKMETSISAPIAGTVKSVEVAPADVVESGDLLVVIEP